MSLGIEQKATRVSCGKGCTEFEAEAEGSAHHLANFAVKLKNEAGSQSLIFLWNPPAGKASVFSKGKAAPAFTLALRLVDSRTNAAYWTLKADFTNVKVKDARVDPRMGEQLVEIEYDKMNYSRG